MIFLPIFCSFFGTILFQILFLFLDLVRSFAGEEFAGEEEEEVTGEALAYIAGEEFTGASERRKEKP